MKKDDVNNYFNRTLKPFIDRINLNTQILRNDRTGLIVKEIDLDNNIKDHFNNQIDVRNFYNLLLQFKDLN